MSSINSNAAINAEKIANGDVDNTEFEYLDGLQAVVDGKVNKELKLGFLNKPKR